MNYGARLPPLPNGAPAVRLRHLAQRLHDLGPRSLLGFLEELLAGKMLDARAVVDRLERHAQFPPEAMRALGGYELESPVLDITWVIRLPSAETKPAAEEL